MAHQLLIVTLVAAVITLTCARYTSGSSLLQIASAEGTDSANSVRSHEALRKKLLMATGITSTKALCKKLCELGWDHTTRLCGCSRQHLGAWS